MEEDLHSGFVASWMDQVGNGLPPERLVQLFERAIGAMWQRCRVTLGEVTLGVIVDRVLHHASETFPVLAPLKVEPNGVCFDHLRDNAGTLDRDQLAGGIRFVLIHFLGLLGVLTAEVLTPALHAELLRVALDEPQDQRVSPTDKPGEDVKP
jgi:hypothetical protein